MIKWLTIVAEGITGAGAGDFMSDMDDWLKLMLFGQDSDPGQLESLVYIPGHGKVNANDKNKYIFEEFQRELPLIGPWLRFNDNVNYWQDYLDATGLSWSDIKNHKVNLGYGSAMMSTLNFVSRNIDKLYKKM